MGKTLKRQQKKLLKQANSAVADQNNTQEKKKPFQVGHCVVKINAALQNQRWTKAIDLLKLMHDAQKKPKLGTLMRWIRMADTTGNSSITARLYYWMLVVVGWDPIQLDDNADVHLTRKSPSVWSWNPLKHLIKRESSSQHSMIQLGDEPVEIPTGSQVRVFTYPASTISFAHDLNSISALPVPFVPGALLLSNVFTRNECFQLIAAAEKMGFQSGVDYSFNAEFSLDNTASTSRSTLDSLPTSMKSNINSNSSNNMLESNSAGRPAEGCFWLVDSTILDIIQERTLPHLPNTWLQKSLKGINARFRFYRYDPGTIYRPHIDGSWPGSGLDPTTGQYIFDAFHDQWSCFTFLVYLNDDFEGGFTRFYRPSSLGGEELETFEVCPCQGSVLVFPHGTLDAALHEGGPVYSGSKYVIRTDVLYTK